MIKDIVIVGAGGHAKEIAYLIEDINMEKKAWNLLGYIDRDKSNIGKLYGKYEVVGDDTFFEDFNSELNLVVAIGSPDKVKTVYGKISVKYPEIRFPNLIHPSAARYIRDVSVGKGNTICAGNIFTTDIKIGSYNCINRGCNISHDVVIGDCCVINPGVNISGGVIIKSSCLIGTGSTLLQYLIIGENSIVGAGAVVTKDVKSGNTVVGIPAEPIS